MRESLLRSELRERVAFPLSRVHYVETWRHGNAQKRRDLAEEMMIFSRLLTLAPAQMLWRHEIDHALHTAFGKPTEIAPIPAWGQGALHAFGHDNDSLFPSKLAGDPFFEFLLLAGSGSDKFLSEDRARHLAEQQFADNQSQAAARLAGWRSEPAERRQRFRVQALTEFQADILPALIAADISPEELSGLDMCGLESLVKAIPTI